MQVFVNQIPYELSAPASLRDALTAARASPPFAAAVNLQFVPRAQYESTPLKAGDQIEVIAPITGG